MILPKNTTSQLIRVRILDSSLTTGAGKTGLDNNLASINAYYIREGASTVINTTVTTGSLGTHAEGSFVPVSNASMPGVYEYGAPNTAFSAGSNSVILYFDGVTDMKQTAKEIQLWGVNPQDSSAYGMKYLSNANTRLDTVLSTYLDTTLSNVLSNTDTAVTRADTVMSSYLDTAVSSRATAGDLKVYVTQ